MKRFWFEFDNPPSFSPLGLGCGVTATNLIGALDIVRRMDGGAELVIARTIEDVDVSTLDPHHVRPNMGNPMSPGVWFPLGYG